MSDSNPLTSSRPTLKLKVAARQENKTTPSPRPQGKLIKKPGAALSDELKHQMQEDMDALASR